MMASSLTESQLQQAVDMYLAGEKLTDIYEATKVYSNALHRQMKRMGLGHLARKKRQPNPQLRNQQAIEEYIRGNISVKNVAKKYGISHSVLTLQLRILRNEGVSMPIPKVDLPDAEKLELAIAEYQTGDTSIVAIAKALQLKASIIVEEFRRQGIIGEGWYHNGQTLNQVKQAQKVIEQYRGGATIWQIAIEAKSSYNTIRSIISGTGNLKKKDSPSQEKQLNLTSTT